MTGPPALLRAAPVLFVLLWSSGWVPPRIIMPFAEPLTFLSVRYALAAAILAGMAWAAAAEWPRTRLGIAHAMISGVLLHAMYLGGLWWAVTHGLPVAISGLITALQPILTALLAPWLAGETITRRQWQGIVLGFVGIALVLSPALARVPLDRLDAFLLPLAVNVCGMVGVTLGTFYQKRFLASGDLRASTALQNLGALAATLPLAIAVENVRIVWSLEVILAMIWTVLAMSIGAVLLLLLLIRHGAVSRAATLIYLMPPLVALQAVVLFDEVLAPVQVVGMAVTALGVALAVRRAP